MAEQKNDATREQEERAFRAAVRKALAEARQRIRARRRALGPNAPHRITEPPSRN